MRFACLVVATFCVTLSVGVASAGTNVLYNSDFEMSGSDVPGWKVTSGTAKYTVVRDSRRKGRCIEGIETAPGGDLGRLLQFIDGRVISGEPYRLTGWIKTDDVKSSGGVVIGVGTVNANGELIPGSFRIEIGKVKGTTDWTYYDSGNFVLPALTPGTIGHAIYLDFNGNGGGVARFDDVSLVGPPGLPLPAQSSQVEFGRFGIGTLAWALMIVLSISALWAYRKYDAYRQT